MFYFSETWDEMLEKACKAKPIAPYRTKYIYNNVLYTAGARIAEKATGEEWDDLLQNRIFDPLGMEGSYPATRPARDDDNLVSGYVWCGLGYKALKARNEYNIRAIGGVCSTLDDMTEWLRLLLQHGTYEGKQLISPGQLEQTWGRHLNMGTDNSGFGWVVMDWKGQTLAYHTGSHMGCKTVVALLPESGLGFVMMTNRKTNYPLKSVLPIFDTLLTDPPTTATKTAQIQQDPRSPAR